jgi:hypothetical protein
MPSAAAEKYNGNREKVRLPQAPASTVDLSLCALPEHTIPRPLEWRRPKGLLLWHPNDTIQSLLAMCGAAFTSEMWPSPQRSHIKLTIADKRSNVLRVRAMVLEVNDMSKNNSNKRRFLQGTAVLVAALTGSLTANTAGAVAIPGASKSDGQSQPEFVVSPPSAGGAQAYQHESHSSHQSHTSHASHASHSSHYSNAG